MFQRYLLVFMLLLFCLNCSESQNAREERLLNELQLATQDLKKCLVAQRDEGQCNELEKAKEVALLTCVKFDIDGRRLQAAMELGEHAVKGDPRYSPYNVVNRYIKSLGKFSWTTAFSDKDADNFFTKNCPNGFEADEHSYRFYSMVELTLNNGKYDDFYINKSNDYQVKEGSYQHVFLYKLEPGYCYDPHPDYPIVKADDLESINNKYFKPSPQAAKNTNGRILVLHIGDTIDDANLKFEASKGKFQKIEVLRKELKSAQSRLELDKNLFAVFKSSASQKMISQEKNKTIQAEKNIKRLESEIEKLSQEILKGN